jgi:hypothetical protein
MDEERTGSARVRNDVNDTALTWQALLANTFVRRNLADIGLALGSFDWWRKNELRRLTRPVR